MFKCEAGVYFPFFMFAFLAICKARSVVGWEIFPEALNWLKKAGLGINSLNAGKSTLSEFPVYLQDFFTFVGN